MSYRPICDTFWGTRAKLLDGHKLYGAFPGGFLERARYLVMARPDEPVLHVCSGRVRYYPYQWGFGEHDKTLDLDPAMEPDHQIDAGVGPYPTGFRAVLADPPYSPEDAEKYTIGACVYPSPNRIVSLALESLPRFGCVGILHYGPPGMRKDAKFVTALTVYVGGNNKGRTFSVFQKR